MKRQTAKGVYKSYHDSALVLLAFYSGLRKSELYGLYVKDLIRIDNIFYIYVTGLGMKKLGLKLKTHSAKRRVKFEINNNEHFDILAKWLNAREQILPNAKYLFLHFDEKKIYSKVMDVEKFSTCASTMRSICKRYITFHSLRHSFATYSYDKIRSMKNSSPYKFLELSIMMGHQSPDITINSYIHYDLLRISPHTDI